MTTKLLAVSAGSTLPIEGTDGATTLVLSSRTISRRDGYYGGDAAVWTAQPSGDQGTWNVSAEAGQGRSQTSATNLYDVRSASFYGDNQYRAAAQYSFYAHVLAGAYGPSLSVFA